ncbi:hypothetical protein H9P43_009074 [Blastocladiella emersonii ATCC 22665]|nr:hypothetical protein H9P43_009074 [Blastocladiella emersonii ATCC 22665]
MHQLLLLVLFAALALTASASPLASDAQVALALGLKSSGAAHFKSPFDLSSAIVQSPLAPATRVEVTDVSPCRKNSDSDALVLHSLELRPDPPQRGQKFGVIATGTLKRRVDRPASIHLVVKLGRFIQLLKQDLDLCDEAGKVQLACPLEEGDVRIASEFDLPEQIPPGTYYITADVTDQDKAPVTCIQAQLKFS